MIWTARILVVTWGVLTTIPLRVFGASDKQTRGERDESKDGQCVRSREATPPAFITQDRMDRWIGLTLTGKLDGTRLRLMTPLVKDPPKLWEFSL